MSDLIRSDVHKKNQSKRRRMEWRSERRYKIQLFQHIVDIIGNVRFLEEPVML